MIYFLFYYLMVFVVFIFCAQFYFFSCCKEIWNMKYNYYYCKFTTWSTSLTLGRTCKFIPPPWFQGGREGGGWNPPLVFDMFQYFETILPAVESLWSSLKDEVHFIGGGDAGGLWHHQQWWPSWPPSWILPRIRNQVKTARNGDFFVLEMKNNT